jgi:hypothetical protein
MKRPNITPGPWNFTKGVIPCINASIDRHQVNVAKTIYGSHDEALSNARAIAALPSVYEAASNLVFETSITDHGENYVEISRENYAALISALRLAGYEF